MAYEPYADKAYYLGTYKEIPEGDIIKYLKQASRHVDTLTFNRIVGIGFDNLTEFQQDIIKEVVCLQAEFEYINQDILDNILSSYSINGVSMGFSEGWNVKIQNGVAMKQDTYSLLSQTGLTCRLLR